MNLDQRLITLLCGLHTYRPPTMCNHPLHSSLTYT